MAARDWRDLIVLAAIWGASFYFIGIILHDLPPFSLVAARLVLAAAALNLVLLWRGIGLPRDREAVFAFLVQGLIANALPFVLLAYGQSQNSAALAAILNATTPLWTVLLAHWLTMDERITLARAAGVLVGFGGVATMIGVSALEGVGAAVLGQLACLAATLSYGYAGIFGRRFRTLGIAPLVVATGQLTASSLMMAPLALIVDRPWAMAVPHWDALAALLGLALVSTAFAYVLYFRVLARAGATASSLVTFLVPVSAILLATFLLGERLAARHGLGMAAIALGLALIDGRPARWLAGQLAWQSR